MNTFLKNHFSLGLCFGECILCACDDLCVVLGKMCYMKVCARILCIYSSCSSTAMGSSNSTPPLGSGFLGASSSSSWEAL